MVGTVVSASLQGMKVHFIYVEADVGNGLPAFHMVGHLASEVRESGERVRTAVQNSGIRMPARKVVINLSPANVRKHGAAFDLPVAAAVLSAAGIIDGRKLAGTVVIGELGLDGRVRKVPGVLPIVAEAKKQGYRKCILPAENEGEGRIVEGIETIPVSDLPEFIRFVRSGTADTASGRKKSTDGKKSAQRTSGEALDFSDIRGQRMVKRAAEIAVAGQHNLLMVGPPGAGKTMAAKRIPTIFPALTKEESIEISKIYSVSGLLDEDCPLIRSRPFREVHHTVTRAALVGGGACPLPGEISLAHGGCLFLDEAAEVKKEVLEALREPLEERRVRLVRNGRTYDFPADVILLAAANPCPCGFFPDYNRCTCSEREIRAYRGKMSGPLLDRIDIWVDVPQTEYANLTGHAEEETSAQIRERVSRAREVQNVRYAGAGNTRTNGRVPARELLPHCVLDEESEALMRLSFEKLNLTARSYYKVLRVARTIADLDGSERIETIHLSEAIACRSMDRK